MTDQHLEAHVIVLAFLVVIEREKFKNNERTSTKAICENENSTKHTESG